MWEELCKRSDSFSRIMTSNKPVEDVKKPKKKKKKTEVLKVKEGEQCPLCGGYVFLVGNLLKCGHCRHEF